MPFGGAEPLLNAPFIAEVMKLGAKEWYTSIETTLNVPIEDWIGLTDYVDEYVVDVKDVNHFIYESYTGSSNDNVFKNLNELRRLGFSQKVLIRLPIIPGFNDENDVLKSFQMLDDMGFAGFNRFKYKICDGW